MEHESSNAGTHEEVRMRRRRRIAVSLYFDDEKMLNRFQAVAALRNSNMSELGREIIIEQLGLDKEPFFLSHMEHQSSDNGTKKKQVA